MKNVFSAYSLQKLRVNNREINCRTGGAGPPLLLLHGHPQTHYMWHKVADELAENFTVVAVDLRGYGDSEKVPASDDHSTYSKREMAADQVALMHKLGFNHFAILAHDRGARVAHRLAVDHPQVVSKMIFLDIAPTLCMYENTDETFARAYWHWFFLIRPAPLPESLIEFSPNQYIKSVMGARSAGMRPFAEHALQEYQRCLSLKGTATAICEDYRASTTIDLTHDRADLLANNKITCPLLVLWGNNSIISTCFEPKAEWEKVATTVEGFGLDCGHYIAEELPDELLQHSLDFLIS